MVANEMIVLSFCLPLKEALFEGSGVTRSTSAVEGQCKHYWDNLGVVKQNNGPCRTADACPYGS